MYWVVRKVVARWWFETVREVSAKVATKMTNWGSVAFGTSHLAWESGLELLHSN